MDKLGRYYTADAFSNLLINQFSNETPKSIIDLGVGGGSLIKAAINRWVNASYFAVDIDKKSIFNLQNELPFVNSFHLNTLQVEISDKLKLPKGAADIAICNPPYLKIKNKVSYDSLFDEAKLSQCKNLKILTSDMIFLAKNLQLLKDNGELGIILPDSLLTGKDYIHLRSAILKEHNLKAVIELPERIFSRTEALTHILLIEKSGESKSKTPLFLADKTGQIIDEIEVRSSLLNERMDFKYHLFNKTHKELKDSGDFFVHTTDIISKKANQALKNHVKKNSKYLLTQKGDILLARVGRGCTGKVCLISRGKAPISDCVYRIRVASKYRYKVWNSLVSDMGQNWLKANCHGVCAKVISKNDLLRFPLK
jgi:type I restriction enzyme M protein